MKWLGAALILLGSFWMGASLIQKMDRRTRTLRALTAALDILTHELDFSLPAMPDWLEAAAGRSPEPVSAFLRSCARRLRRQEGQPMTKIWSGAAQQCLSDLKSCDMQALLTVGQVLGRYDATSQRDTLTAARRQLEELAVQAAQERRRCGKVYGTLCGAGGMLLVILLL